MCIFWTLSESRELLGAARFHGGRMSWRAPRGSRWSLVVAPAPPPAPPYPGRSGEARLGFSRFLSRRRAVLESPIWCPESGRVLVLGSPFEGTTRSPRWKLNCRSSRRPAAPRGSGPVGGGARSAALDLAGRRVGPFKGFQLSLNHLHMFQHLGNVGVHSGPQILHGFGVVGRLTLLVRLLQTLVQ
nr:hypothetical protein Iba_chr14dCG16160 [Ipomoea batatas]GME04710.1 hypothetical protein Iba_scaffold2300CG1220 [Ipomoea batatas]